MNKSIKYCPWCDQPGHSGLCLNCIGKAQGLNAMSDEELDSLPYGIITVDNHGKVVHYSRYEQEFSGRKPENVIGKNFFKEIAPCTEVKEFYGRFESFLQSTESEREEFTFTFPFPDGIFDVYIVFFKKNVEQAFIVVKKL